MMIPNKEPLTAEVFEAACKMAEMDPLDRGREFWMVRIQGQIMVIRDFVEAINGLVEAFQKLADAWFGDLAELFDQFTEVANSSPTLYCPRHGTEMRGGFCRRCHRPPRHTHHP